MSSFSQLPSFTYSTFTVDEVGLRFNSETLALRLGHQLATLELQLPYLGLCIFYPEQELFYSKKHKTFVLPIIKNVQLSQLKMALKAYWQHYHPTQQVA